jgi:hypothetical protein
VNVNRCLAGGVVEAPFVIGSPGVKIEANLNLRGCESR